MKQGSRAFKFSIAFIFLIALWILFAPFFAENLIVEKPLAKADAILMLAGSGVYHERTQKAAEIYKQGAATKIVLPDDGERTGWSRAEKRNIPYVELAQRNLIALGVPLENIEIIKLNGGSGTIYEARLVREKARADGWRSVLLVTSAYHTRRSLATFEKVLADESLDIGIVGAPPGQQTPPAAYWWLTADGWNWIGGEYVKSFYYWVYY